MATLHPVPDEAEALPAAEDFEALLRDVLDNPEKALDKGITDEQVEQLVRRLQPHSSLIGEPPAAGRRALIACSYSNLSEAYIRRFQMTSLAGFLFQMLEEWEVPEEQRRWTPARKKAPKAAYTPAELVEMLEGVLAIARQAARRGEPGSPSASPSSAGSSSAASPSASSPSSSSASSSSASSSSASSSSASPSSASSSSASPSSAASASSSSAPSSMTSVAPSSAASAAGSLSAAGGAYELGAPQAAPGVAEASPEAAEAALVYTATHVLSRLGAEAAERLRPAWAAARKHATAREVLQRYPVPAPPSEQTTPAAVAKKALEGFLKYWLEFDPSVHVRAGHDEKALEKDLASARVDSKDPERHPLESLRAPAAVRPEHAEALAAIRAARLGEGVLALLSDPGLAAAVDAARAAPAAFREYLAPVAGPARAALAHVPPQDTFHRWQFYTDCNYEQLRRVTQALYPERPDIDFAIAPWQAYEGPAAGADAWFAAFCRRWEDKTPSSIFSVEVGRGWTLLGSFAKNRDRTEFYNRNTEVLERIIRRHEEDQKLGAQLMKKRIQVKKAENIRRDGPDAKGLGAYRQNQGGLEVHGAQKLPPEELKRLEAAGGDLKKAEDLRLLSEYRATIKELGEAKRELTFDEQRNLDIARRSIARAEEMAAVPPDAVQVDVFATDGRGGFSRSHFYTEAEAPAAPEEPRRGAELGSLHPMARRAAEPRRAPKPE